MAAYTTIDDPEAYFQVQLYTGDGSADHAITLGGDTDMQPDLVWIKNRDAADAHMLFDAVRGVTKVLNSDDTSAEATDTDTLDSFTSDGFQVDADAEVNTDSEKYVAWCWKESATAGFDIVAFEGTGSAHTESHSLSAVPNLMIFKNRDATDGNAQAWAVYHHRNTSAPATDRLILNTTEATYDEAIDFNDTDPTSSVFSVGTGNRTNRSGDSIIAYLFAEKQGFSHFGTYEGNGNADGTFVYTGFRPAFVICKAIDSTSSWFIFDDQREGYNKDNDAFEIDPAGTYVEATTDMIDLFSNGFKCRIATDPNVAETYIYMAFAKAPFVNTNGVPCNAR